jgi:hypothetical protein
MDAVIELSLIELGSYRKEEGELRSKMPRYFVGSQPRTYELRHFVAKPLSLDAKLLHSAAQSVGMQVEDSCGSFGTFDDSSRLLENG